MNSITYFIDMLNAAKFLSLLKKGLTNINMLFGLFWNLSSLILQRIRFLYNHVSHDMYTETVPGDIDQSGVQRLCSCFKDAFQSLELIKIQLTYMVFKQSLSSFKYPYEK